jgi:hemoglobin-like flavoprotein
VILQAAPRRAARAVEGAMQLSEQQIRDIRASYARIKPEAERISHLFYEDLFRREPRLRQLFGPDLGHQPMSFMTALEAIVGHLDNPEALDALVDELGRRHAPLHIRPEAYRAMEDSLIDTMAYALGQHLTNPVERAWRSAFGQIGAAMIERGRKDAEAAEAAASARE